MKKILLLFIAFSSAANFLYAQGFEEISSVSPMNITRLNHASVALPDGKVLVVGGHIQGFDITSTAEIYDPIADTWTLYNIDNAHDGCSFVELNDGRFMFYGGFPYGGGSGQSNATTIYDPVAGLFSNGPTMNVSRAFSSAVKLSDNRVLVVGNWYNTGDAEIYDPVANNFTSVGTPVMERANPLVFPCNDGGAVVIGGYGIYGSPNYSDVVYFDPSNSQFTSLASELIDGETGWITSWYASYGPISDVQLSNGNYVFMIYKMISASEYQYALAEFNPETKEITKLTSTPEIPFYSGMSPNEWSYGLHLMVDPTSDFVYFMGVGSSTAPYLARLYAFDTETGTLEVPSGSTGYDYYIYSSSKTWVNGNLLCTGGTIDGSNFSITNEAKLLGPLNSLSVQQLENSVDISVFPNPVSTSTFKVNSGSLAIDLIEILDLRGNLVKRMEVNVNEQTNTVDSGNLTNGFYLLRMSSSTEVYTKKILLNND
jgi:hypothetical protein